MLFPAWGEALSNFQFDDCASKKTKKKNCASKAHFHTKSKRPCIDLAVGSLNPKGGSRVSQP